MKIVFIITIYKRRGLITMLIKNNNLLIIMIISASRRTDLPAFFPEWTIKEIVTLCKAEQEPLISTNKPKHGVVFWTKNPEPIIPYLSILDKKNIVYYFQYTLNDYPDLEPNVPPLSKRIETFLKLSDLIGKNKVIWRYDPILINSKYSIDDIINKVHFIGTHIHKSTNKLVFSFLDPYPKIPNDIHPPTKYQECEFVRKLLLLNQHWNLKLSTCAEVPTDEISPNRCIDPYLLEELGLDISDYHSYDKSQRLLCACYPSKDIGEYHTCKHNCAYCYAR